MEEMKIPLPSLEINKSGSRRSLTKLTNFAVSAKLPSPSSMLLGNLSFMGFLEMFGVKTLQTPPSENVLNSIQGAPYQSVNYS